MKHSTISIIILEREWAALWKEYVDGSSYAVEGRLTLKSIFIRYGSGNLERRLPRYSRNSSSTKSCWLLATLSDGTHIWAYAEEAFAGRRKQKTVADYLAEITGEPASTP